MATLTFNEDRLRNFDFSPIKERLISEQGWSDAAYAAYEEELRRYFVLIGTTEGPLAMISHKVDELWHKLILFTPIYRKFCQEIFGRFIDHLPRTDLTPIPVAAINNFIKAYVSAYGSLNPVWLEDVPDRWKESVARGAAPEEIALKWSGWPGASQQDD